MLAMLVLLVMHLESVPLVDDWHLLLGKTAGVDQKDSHAVCSHQGHLHPCRGAEAVFQTTDIPQLRRAVFPAPSHVAVQRPIPVVQTVRRTKEFLQFFINKQGDRCPCCTGRASRCFSCRGAEIDSHGLVDHGDSPETHCAMSCGDFFWAVSLWTRAP